MEVYSKKFYTTVHPKQCIAWSVILCTGETQKPVLRLQRESALILAFKFYTCEQSNRIFYKSTEYSLIIVFIYLYCLWVQFSAIILMASAARRTDRPQLRSNTWGSLQTLTRALRESLRLRKLRKQRRLRDEGNDKQMRTRSKSVGNAYVDDEISEVCFWHYCCMLILQKLIFVRNIAEWTTEV